MASKTPHPPQTSAPSVKPSGDLVAPVMSFDEWIRVLDEDVIQGEFGYEDGEFAVYPEHWRGLFKEGLTPQQAFRRALDGFADARREEDGARAANWARIQAEDAAAIERSAQAASPLGGPTGAPDDPESLHNPTTRERT